MQKEMTSLAEAYLVQLKASVMWFHSAHHVAKGKGFVSDHKDLYGKIYTELDDHFDELVEKSIILSGDEFVACPINLSKGISIILESHYHTPANKNSEEIIHQAIIVMSNLLNSITFFYEKAGELGYLTLGLNDSLSGMANLYEQYMYKLGQRHKE